MKTKSPIVDPRIIRLDLEKSASFNHLDNMEVWGTYEVFHQKKRGEQHIHAGVVHAPDPEMALIFAKEQYGRRLKCANLWVVKTSDIYSIGYENEDMFETVAEKIYREAGGYKLREKISDYKKSIASRNVREEEII
jgi:ring-1,2-phenylacetyl-CoA epoxidase subunit PaaB